MNCCSANPIQNQSWFGFLLQISSRTTLKKYFTEPVGARILVQIKDGREVYYINSDLVKILEG